MRRLVILIFAFVLISPIFAAPTVSNRAVNPDVMMGYIPGEVASVNPPPISWVPEPAAEGGTWNLQVAPADTKFAAPVFDITTKWLMYTHFAPLAAGVYEWRYRFTTTGGETSDWSLVRRFTVAGDTPQCPRPPTDELVKNIPVHHPRAMIRPEDLAQLRESKTQLPEDFAKMLALADNALSIPLMVTPEPWEEGVWNNAQWLKYLRAATDSCRAMENLAFTYMITGEKMYAVRAREHLMNMTTWDTHTSAPSGMSCNDEITMALIWGSTHTYSWIHDILTETERSAVRDMIRARCIDGMVNKLKRPDSHFEQYAFDSHNGRIWHMLGEAGIVFYGEIPEAKEWLDYALTIFFGWYPAWGDNEGGWSEGMHYYCSYNDLVTQWLEEMKTELKCNPAAKPIYKNIGWQGFYLTPPGGAISAFGDFGENPAPIQRGRVLAYYAQMTGNAQWQWFADKVGLGDYQGWSSYLAAFRPKPTPQDPKLKQLHHILPTAGFATIMSNYGNPKENVQLTMRAAPRGNLSHSHQDQGAIILAAFGDQVLVNSGVRDSYGSEFCKEWYWNTKAHNALVFDENEGQPRTPAAKAKFVNSGGERGEPFQWIVADMSGAYETKTTEAKRFVAFDDGKTVIILTTFMPKPDTKSATLVWHARVPFEQKGDAWTVTTENAHLTMHTQVLPQLALTTTQTDCYSMAPLAAAVTKPEWHLWQKIALDGKTQPVIVATTLNIKHKNDNTTPTEAPTITQPEHGKVAVKVGGKSTVFDLNDNSIQ